MGNLKFNHKTLWQTCWLCYQLRQKYQLEDLPPPNQQNRIVSRICREINYNPNFFSHSEKVSISQKTVFRFLNFMHKPRNFSPTTKRIMLRFLLNNSDIHFDSVYFETHYQPQVDSFREIYISENPDFLKRIAPYYNESTENYDFNASIHPETKKNRAAIEESAFMFPRVWLMYFFDGKHSKSQQPSLAKALLSTANYNKASLKLPHARFDTYVGTYYKLQAGILVFDLKTKREDKHIHLKVMYKNPKDELMMGLYNSYDKNLMMGNFLLQQHPYSNRFFEQQPAFLSSVENSTSFGNVPDAIKDYLRLKSENLMEAPKAPFEELKGLQHYLQNGRITDSEAIESRFVELAKPIIYFAACDIKHPNKQQHTDMVTVLHQIFSRTKRQLNGGYQVFYFKNRNDNAKWITRRNSSETEAIQIRKARYFVLLIPDATSDAFSLVQLGWAITYCKKILLIYEGEAARNPYSFIDNASKDYMVRHFVDFALHQKEIISEIVNFVQTNALFELQ